MRRATSVLLNTQQRHIQFLSTLSLRRATLQRQQFEANSCISIHALLAESDPYAKKFGFCDLISIHALLAESDIKISFLFRLPKKFLSTLSLRRATFNASCSKPIHAFLSTLSLRRATIRKGTAGRINGNFYPRSPCGERRSGSQQPSGTTNFYPRSPCGERQGTCNLLDAHRVFLSTLSLRRATAKAAATQWTAI